MGNICGLITRENRSENTPAFMDEEAEETEEAVGGGGGKEREHVVHVKVLFTDPGATKVRFTTHVGCGADLADDAEVNEVMISHTDERTLFQFAQASGITAFKIDDTARLPNSTLDVAKRAITGTKWPLDITDTPLSALQWPSAFTWTIRFT
jgi:hypothetical protein